MPIQGRIGRLLRFTGEHADNECPAVGPLGFQMTLQEYRLLGSEAKLHSVISDMAMTPIGLIERFHLGGVMTSGCAIDLQDG